MDKLAEFNEIVRDFKDVADFVMVYISEAHPLDGWAVNHETYKRYQHTSLEERFEAAKVLKDEGIDCEVVVESMTDESIEMYASLPERLYIIQDGVIRLRGGLGPFNYEPKVVRKWLEKNCKEEV